jgi:hypothetical protein
MRPLVAGSRQLGHPATPGRDQGQLRAGKKPITKNEDADDDEFEPDIFHEVSFATAKS